MSSNRAMDALQGLGEYRLSVVRTNISRGLGKFDLAEIMDIKDPVTALEREYMARAVADQQGTARVCKSLVCGKPFPASTVREWFRIDGYERGIQQQQYAPGHAWQKFFHSRIPALVKYSDLVMDAMRAVFGAIMHAKGPQIGSVIINGLYRVSIIVSMLRYVVRFAMLFDTTLKREYDAKRLFCGSKEMLNVGARLVYATMALMEQTSDYFCFFENSDNNVLLKFLEHQMQELLRIHSPSVGFRWRKGKHTTARGQVPVPLVNLAREIFTLFDMISVAAQQPTDSAEDLAREFVLASPENRGLNFSFSDFIAEVEQLPFHTTFLPPPLHAVRTAMIRLESAIAPENPQWTQFWRPDDVLPPTRLLYVSTAIVTIASVAYYSAFTELTQDDCAIFKTSIAGLYYDPETAGQDLPIPTPDAIRRGKAIAMLAHAHDECPICLEVQTLAEVTRGEKFLTCECKVEMHMKCFQEKVLPTKQCMICQAALKEPV
jgi:hypothetical protein